jgi:hypothetical protein
MNKVGELDEKLLQLKRDSRIIAFPFLSELGDEIDSMYIPCGLDRDSQNLRKMENPIIATVIENINGRLRLIDQDGMCLQVEYGDVKNIIMLADRVDI